MKKLVASAVAAASLAVASSASATGYNEIGQDYKLRDKTDVVLSGYLRTRSKHDAEAHRGADASHAWVSAWCGKELGWVDFDPTNNLVVDDQHIVLAHGRDFSDVTPLRGVILGGGEHGLEVLVTVTPLDD